MMTFNSQICTSREQSERLLALGLKKETADMKWLGCSDENGDIYYMLSDVPHHFRSTDIPAWSLHRLWELANIKHIILDSEDEIAVLYDEVIMKIEQFIEEGYFNKSICRSKREAAGRNSMTGKADIVIGIDPDVNKSGVGVVSRDGRVEACVSLTFPQLLEYLQIEKDRRRAENLSVVVVVEASWKISTNWHTGRGDSIRTAARKGKDAGRCHEVGRKIVECAQYYGLEVVERLPLKKIWKGKDGKITDAEIKAFMPIQGRTNQEERDAALLAWDYAGLPIRIRTIKTK